MKRILCLLALTTLAFTTGCHIGAPDLQDDAKTQSSKQPLLIQAYVSTPMCPAEHCPLVARDLISYVETIRSKASSHFDETYSEPGNIATFRSVVTLIWQQKWAQATALAKTIKYEIVRFYDTGEVNGCDKTTYHLLRPIPEVPTGAHEGWGVYFFRAKNAPRREIAIEAPHVVKDMQTARLSAELFRNTRAQMFAMSSNHRCGHEDDTDCSSGSGTSVCNDDDDDNSKHDYRKSDMSHTRNSYFQAFHETVNDLTSLKFLQIHGNGSSNNEFSFGNGTKVLSNNPDLPINALSIAFLERINQALALKNKTPVTGGSCNWGGNNQPDLVKETKLCGTLNTQGRYTNINGQNLNACMDNASSATHRFFHIELKRDLRDAEKAGEANNLSRFLLGQAIMSVRVNRAKLFPLLDSKFPCSVPEPSSPSFKR
ncbi:MAG: hypothetical protein EP343_26235 [Deltaproteobacteria bacterium]|nr:MAG: hypothetical protein EP343_26235 [Deltaproteobacteria bacterium]